MQPPLKNILFFPHSLLSSDKNLPLSVKQFCLPSPHEKSKISLRACLLPFPHRDKRRSCIHKVSPSYTLPPRPTSPSQTFSFETPLAAPPFLLSYGTGQLQRDPSTVKEDVFDLHQTPPAGFHCVKGWIPPVLLLPTTLAPDL